ncbi:MAG: hypothetical protein NVSMB63_08590 [Sediminibacterium sp.]
MAMKEFMLLIRNEGGHFGELSPEDQQAFLQKCKDYITYARKNPEFAYGTTASIEVRPVKMKEESTGFVYPAHGGTV